MRREVMDGGGQRRPFMSMSSALAMPFDELSSFVRNGNGSASPSRGFQLGKVVGPSFSFFFFSFFFFFFFFFSNSC